MGLVDDTVAWMKARGVSTEKVPADVQAERIGICEACPRFWKASRQCGVCKCFMDVKTKLVYDPVLSVKRGTATKTYCPQGLWDEWGGKDFVNV